ncbi:gamma-glutamylcyclotransferase [Pseudomonas sp. MAHUQ-58]|nr:gamma-glutamylcyclotransferase [Pseudomonas oryzagri]
MPAIWTRRCSNITLYHLGWFPGAKLESSGGMLAEVYGVDESTLAILDHLEGFRSRNPEHSLFLCQPVETPLGEAWVYVYHHPVDAFESIRSGSWWPDH